MSARSRIKKYPRIRPATFISRRKSAGSLKSQPREEIFFSRTIRNMGDCPAVSSEFEDRHISSWHGRSNHSREKAKPSLERHSADCAAGCQFRLCCPPGTIRVPGEGSLSDEVHPVRGLAFFGV